MCGQLTEPAELGTCITNLPSVRHVRIQSERAMVNCAHYFPNAIELTLEDGFSSRLGLISFTLSRLFSLRQITKLVIEIHYFSFMKLIELLYLMPNIHKLVLESIPLYGLTRDVIELNETFQLVSNLNTITDVVIKDVCTLDKVQLLVALCPRVQHLTINVRARDLKPIVRSLLESRSRHTLSLNLLSFSRASASWLSKLRGLIQSDGLLNDPTLIQNGSTLNLWW